MQRDLTDVWLRTVKPPAAGRLEVWDTRVAGLVLRVMPSGVATWGVRLRTVDGKRTRPKIGAWPAMGITEARKRALATIADIHAGGDPVARRAAVRAERAALAALPTVAGRLAEWQAAKAAGWSERWSTEVRRIADREIVPKLGTRPLAETTRQEWTDLVAAKRLQSPASGSALYRMCASFLGHAEAHGWIASSLLPRKGLAVIAPPVAARDRVLTDDELRAVWQAASSLRPKPRAFVRLLVMTAVRELEAADIATGETDLAAGVWRIQANRTKNGRGIVLPLHPLLLPDLLAVWPRHGAAAGAGWRLLGAIDGNGFRGFSKLKARVDALSGVTAWRWHDLRRTARTAMSRLGVSRDHAEAALNHVSGQSALERTYNRHDYAAEVIAALSVWQGYVAELVGEP